MSASPWCIRLQAHMHEGRALGWGRGMTGGVVKGGEGAGGS